ncbi:uncharacterized protein LOC141855730 [Brevipalpus obovatus]|uniref:uncharacterized protein LOC141855730 n=1 Tax=Brevipalpus obovatus TaxID=246614 RepID=UPI003D9DC37E
MINLETIEKKESLESIGIPPRRHRRSDSKSSIGSSNGVNYYDRDQLAFNHFSEFLKHPLKRHFSSDIAYLIPSMPEPSDSKDSLIDSRTSSGTNNHLNMDTDNDRSNKHVNSIIRSNDPPASNHYRPMHRQNSFDPSGRSRANSSASTDNDGNGSSNRKATSVGNISPLAISLSTEKLFQHLIVQQTQLAKLKHQQEDLRQQLMCISPLANERESPRKGNKLITREKIQQQLHKQQAQVQKHIERLQEQLELVRDIRSSSRASSARDSDSRHATDTSYRSDEDEDLLIDDGDEMDESSANRMTRSTSDIIGSHGRLGSIMKSEPSSPNESRKYKHQHHLSLDEAPHLTVTNPSTGSDEIDIPYMDEGISEAQTVIDVGKLKNRDSHDSRKFQFPTQNRNNNNRMELVDNVYDNGEELWLCSDAKDHHQMESWDQIREYDIGSAGENLQFQYRKLREQGEIMTDQTNTLKNGRMARVYGQVKSFPDAKKYPKQASKTNSGDNIVNQLHSSNPTIRVVPDRMNRKNVNTLQRMLDRTASDGSLNRNTVPNIQSTLIRIPSASPLQWASPPSDDVYVPKIKCPIQQVSPRLSKPLKPRFADALQSNSSNSNSSSMINNRNDEYYRPRAATIGDQPPTRPKRTPKPIRLYRQASIPAKRVTSPPLSPLSRSIPNSNVIKRPTALMMGKTYVPPEPRKNETIIRNQAPLISSNFAYGQPMLQHQKQHQHQHQKQHQHQHQHQYQQQSQYPYPIPTVMITSSSISSALNMNSISSVSSKKSIPFSPPSFGMQSPVLKVRNKKNVQQKNSQGKQQESNKTAFSQPLSIIKSTLLGARNLVSFGSRSNLAKNQDKQPIVPPRRMRPNSPRPKERTQLLSGFNFIRSLSPSRLNLSLFGHKAPKILVDPSSARLNVNKSNNRFGPSANSFSPHQRSRILTSQYPDDTRSILRHFDQYFSPIARGYKSQSYCNLTSNYKRSSIRDLSGSTIIPSRLNDSTSDRIGSSIKLGINDSMRSLLRRQTLPEIYHKKIITHEQNGANNLMKVLAEQRRKHSFPEEELPVQNNSPSLPGWERENVSYLAHEVREARMKAAQMTTFDHIKLGFFWLMRHRLIMILCIFNALLAYLFSELLSTEETARRGFPYRRH